MKEEKRKLSVLQSHSLRELVDTVNNYNQSSDAGITKDDIVGLFHDSETYFLLYFAV